MNVRPAIAAERRAANRQRSRVLSVDAEAGVIRDRRVRNDQVAHADGPNSHAVGIHVHPLEPGRSRVLQEDSRRVVLDRAAGRGRSVPEYGKQPAGADQADPR